MLIKPITEYAKRRKYVSNKGDHKKDFDKEHAGFCVYVVSQSADNCVKVGRTKNLYQRLQVFKTSSPWEVRLEGVAVFISEKDSKEVEKAIHASMQDIGTRVRGEWFSVEMGRLRAALQSAIEGATTRPSKLKGCFVTLSEDLKDAREDLPDFCDTSSKIRTYRRGSQVIPFKHCY